MRQTPSGIEQQDNSDATVLVAMSGGVDSSLAAALLLEQGYPVHGGTMRLWAEGADWDLGQSQCCSAEAEERARRVCQELGIPHTTFDLRREFREYVVEAFVHAYARSHTPNPCIACNRQIKFRFLLQRARGLGFRWLATGHYARIARGEAGDRPIYRLLRGIDRDKDQSYVLYMLTQQELPYLRFPLGSMTKGQVRREATRRRLPSARQAESQEICFIPDDDYRRFLAQQIPSSLQPGPIRDLRGRVLGTHSGLPLYTVGQRKGLGLSGQLEPLYVVALDPVENTLLVGPREALQRSGLEAEAVTFVAGEWPRQPLRVQAQVRYRAAPAPAWLSPQGEGKVSLTFDEPQTAIAPGQSVVFYQGEEVLGGGTIAWQPPPRPERARPSGH